jgi:hypothetical protein
MRKQHALPSDDGAVISLAILSSMLIEVRDLVIALENLPHEPQFNSEASLQALDDVDREIRSLRLNSLLLICSSWLIDRISQVCAMREGTDIPKDDAEITLNEKFNVTTLSSSEPSSEMEWKVNSLCRRLIQLDKNIR